MFADLRDIVQRDAAAVIPDNAELRLDQLAAIQARQFAVFTRE